LHFEDKFDILHIVERYIKEVSVMI
jgi:hypothetical protein